MAKRFSQEDDEYIFTYHCVGLHHMARDLSFSESSIKKRIEFLKKSGAWEAIRQVDAWTKRYRLATKRPCEGDWEYVDHDGAIHIVSPTN